MKNTFATSILISLTLLTSSCSWEQDADPSALDATVYPYLPNQEFMVDVEVVPIGDVEVYLDDMDKETNADYLNRCGIGVRLELGDKMEVPQNVIEGYIFTPNDVTDKPNTITAYIMPREFFNVGMAGGYALIGQNTIVLREDHQKDRTLAHEIGHLLGLEHLDIPDNVMTPYEGRGQYGEPNTFEPWQVDVMKATIKANEVLTSNLTKSIVE